MMRHYLVYNGTRYGPYATSDALFMDLAALVMRDKPTAQARWVTVQTDDEEPSEAQREGECSA